MTPNEIGYKIYVWEQRGYNFSPMPYSSRPDWTKYLNYYSDPTKNAELVKALLEDDTISPFNGSKEAL